MGLRRGFDDELTNPPLHDDHAKLTEDCWCKGATNLMEVKWVQDLMTLFRSSIREEVEEVVKRVILPHLQISALPSTSRSSPHASRSLQLHFVGTLPESNTLLTLTNIQDEGALLKVELRDSSGSIVEVGPESSAQIRIVVLDGDFEEERDDRTQEDFNRNVVKQRKDKGPLLVGEFEVSLNKGVAVVSNISFTDNSKWLRSGKFRLGAQVVKGLPPGVVVREGVSKAFRVKERRLKTQRKLRTPSLDDFVWRLNHIAKNGPICKRLAAEKIYTVQDFLQLYHSDPKKLQNILHVAEKKWPEIVENAESCTLNSECYRYCDGDLGVDLLLDCVFNVASVTFNGQNTLPYQTLDDSLKDIVDKLRRNAYGKRTELPKIYIPTNQLSVQAESLCSSTIITHKNLQYVGATAENQGEQVVQVYSPFQHEFGYQPGVLIDQTPDLDLDQWEELVACLTPSPENDIVVHQASTTSNAASKLKAACYVTKAAMMFMISIQQDPSANPRKKKQKFR